MKRGEQWNGGTIKRPGIYVKGGTTGTNKI